MGSWVPELLLRFLKNVNRARASEADHMGQAQPGALDLALSCFPPQVG